MSVEDFKGQAYLLKKCMQEVKDEIARGERKGVTPCVDVDPHSDSAAFALYCHGEWSLAAAEYSRLARLEPANEAKHLESAWACVERLR